MASLGIPWKDAIGIAFGAIVAAGTIVTVIFKCCHTAGVGTGTTGTIDGGNDKNTTESSVVINNNLTFVSDGIHDTRPEYKSASAPDM